jgi:HEPN domain-containing protein
MVKSPKTGLDPLKIFEHASRFHESDRRLRSTRSVGRNELPLVAHPAMVLSALASELYLKCLLCVETGGVPITHNLRALFRGLQPMTRRRLEDLWDGDIRRPERQKMLDLMRTFPEGRELRLDLMYALDVGADSFIDLRYFYEKQQAFFLLGGFPNLLRSVILERFPSWASVPPTLARGLGSLASRTAGYWD